jgi:hypothetical protein
MMVLVAALLAMLAAAPASSGAASHHLSFAEDCSAIDWRSVKTDNKNGAWRVMSSDAAIAEFGRDKASAERAAEIIRHYRFDQQCFIGRPNVAMSYWKRGDGVPSGGYPDELCVGNDPSATHAKQVAGEWKIVDGRRWLLGFGKREMQARQAEEIVHQYKLNRLCRVSNSVRDTWMYWLSQ